MALDMLDAIGRCGHGDLTLRIGLHTGPVAAGVIDLRGRGPVTTFYLSSRTARRPPGKEVGGRL